MFVWFWSNLRFTKLDTHHTGKRRLSDFKATSGSWSQTFIIPGRRQLFATPYMIPFLETSKRPFSLVLSLLLLNSTVEIITPEIKCCRLKWSAYKVSKKVTTKAAYNRELQLEWQGCILIHAILSNSATVGWSTACQLLFVNIVRFGCQLGFRVYTSRQSNPPSCTQIGRFRLVFFLTLPQ